jgi:hypothetical protein
MTVSPLVWTLTIVLIGGLLLFDFFFHVRKAHTPTLREAATWKYRRYIREEQKLLDLIAKAHAVHDERVRDAG